MVLEFRSYNRHRVSGRPLTPATPPYMVRIRQFGVLSILQTGVEVPKSRSKGGKRRAQGGPVRQGSRFRLIRYPNRMLNLARLSRRESALSRPLR